MTDLKFKQSPLLSTRYTKKKTKPEHLVNTNIILRQMRMWLLMNLGQLCTWILKRENPHWSFCVRSGTAFTCRSAVLIVKPVCALLRMALHRLTRWLNRSWFYARRKWLFGGQRSTDFGCEVCVWSVDTWPGDLVLVLVLALLFSRQNNRFALNLPFRHFIQEIVTGFPFTNLLSSRKHFIILEVPLLKGPLSWHKTAQDHVLSTKEIYLPQSWPGAGRK